MSDTPIVHPEHRMLIDGELVEADSGATFENVNPATEEVIGSVADASTAEMQRAIAAARGRSTPPTGRRTTRCASAASSSCRRRWKPSGRSCASS